MKKHILPLILALVLTLSLLAACSSSNGNAETTDTAGSVEDTYALRVGALKGPTGMGMAKLIADQQAMLKRAQEAGQLEKEERNLTMSLVNKLEQYRQRLRGEEIPAAEAMDAIRTWFGEEVARRKTLGEETGRFFDNAFRFLEETFKQSQELVIFVTEITAGYDTSWFVENFGCSAYFRHNKELLFDDTRHRIREEIAAAKAAQMEGFSHEV